jgi:hypothetical protein
MSWSIVRSQIGSSMLWKFLKLEVFEVILPVFAVIPPTAELLGGSERLLEVPWAVFLCGLESGLRCYRNS